MLNKTPAELADEYLAVQGLIVAQVDEMIAHATARLLAAQTNPREFPSAVAEAVELMKALPAIAGALRLSWPATG
jgi:hypothetical protein